MTLPQVFDLFEYWRSNPPEHEMVSMLAQAFTNWRPARPPMTPEAHLKSLEDRWNSGAAMSPKMMFEAMGGMKAVITPEKGLELPGVGPFPGTKTRP